MPACPSCGHENDERAKFCEECGAPLEAAPAPREQRKTVTVLFCDVTSSTALGESTDPEALRALLARYFERMKGIVESHGGTVEKFIGDAVMAVFGVPQVHEDDAHRACRAAVEMRDALPELGVQARIGVNTGEVVTGTDERLVTGDAVNVAARLEQAAQPAEIVIGEETFGLVRGAVTTGPLEPLALKGKGDPVQAHRLLAVHDAPERAHATSFVGRSEEVELLRRAWQHVLDESRCELVTIVGDAGVGKSRLIAELVDDIETRVVTGRCLSYGEGITYWPVVEVLKQIGVLPADPAAASSLRSLLGESGEGTSADDIAWAFRKLIEECAPIVCVFDDVQWGEQTFLDLVEQVALLSGAPILLLCLARPDFAERRPDWPVSVRLEPLGEADASELIPASLPDDLRKRIAHAAGGNPLFVTEMVAMAAQSGTDVLVPPNLQALLAARLDQLEGAERSVLERGAVEGEVFHRGAVQALSDDRQVVPRLVSLVRKELIRPARPLLPREDAFRFGHLLVRDAAYDALPKSTRAELHRRFADWLEERGAELVERDELVGYHLEQAVLYEQELGQRDEALAERAGARLAIAGRRALSRTDYRAARDLLSRSVALTRSIRLDVQLEVDLANAYDGLGENGRAIGLAESVAARAQAAGDNAGEALARLFAAHSGLSLDGGRGVDELEALGRRALSLLEPHADHAGLVYVWHALGSAGSLRGDFEAAAEAATHAVEQTRLAGQPDTGSFGLGQALLFGPRPADEALATLEDLFAGTTTPGPRQSRVLLLGMLGRFDEARVLAEDVARRLRDSSGWDGAGSPMFADLATYEGDHETAERHLRIVCARMEALGRQGYLATYAPFLGRTLCDLGRYEEAETFAVLGRDIGDVNDYEAQALWRGVLARVYANRGDVAAAEVLASEAIEIVDGTDSLNSQAEARIDLAEVLVAAGRTDDAAAALEQALDRFERKKNLAMAAQVQPKLEELRARVS